MVQGEGIKARSTLPAGAGVVIATQHAFENDGFQQ
jgi:hypothetical protein